VAVPTNHRDEVERLLADYRRSREQLASVHRALRSITESVTSDDGLVTATVDSAGTLCGLVITDEAYRRLRPAELSDLVVRVTRRAAARAGEQARQVLAPVLPAGADPAAALSGVADLSPAEVAPAPSRAAADTYEETYEDVSWMSGRGR
jgi:hypothetical protein